MSRARGIFLHVVMPLTSHKASQPNLDKGTALWNYTTMNAKQRKTLAAIFREPTSAGIEWRSAASLIKGLGDDIRHRDGSSVRIDLKAESINIHSLHPQKELKRYAVRLVRELLIRTGDTP